MDRERDYTSFIYVIIDILVIIASFMLAYFIRFKTGLFASGWALSLSEYLYSLIFIIPVYIIVYYLFNLYISNTFHKKRKEIFNIFKANVVGVLFFILFLYFEKESNFSRIMLFMFVIINMFLQILTHFIIRRIIIGIRKNRRNKKRVLVVGFGGTAKKYIDRVLARPDWGYEICGILDEYTEFGYLYNGIKVIGTIDNLEILLPRNNYDEIVIAVQMKDYPRLERIVNLCEKSGVHTKFIPDYFDIIPTKPYTQILGGLTVINIRRVPLSDNLRSFAKRLVDIIGAIFAIIIFSPIMIIISVIIKMTSSGPVLYKQVRVGLHNKNFEMYKFRSMIVQDKEKEKKEWTTKDDPRVTKIGKFIRKTSIDELPQFFNVLMGDMSIVGPRPERPQYVDKFKDEIPRYKIKHQVRPGITGWAQVNGFRGDTSIEKRIEYDLYYIENWTMSFDIKIMFLTIFKGFVNSNAY